MERSDRADRYPQVAAPTQIDKLIVDKLRKVGIVPSPGCTDAEFLRRVSLDLTGTLPTPHEIEAFLADRSPDKRAKKIDELAGNARLRRLVDHQALRPDGRQPAAARHADSSSGSRPGNGTNGSTAAWPTTRRTTRSWPGCSWPTAARNPARATPIIAWRWAPT